MFTTRRRFIDSLATGTLALGALPLTLDAMPPDVRGVSRPPAGDAATGTNAQAAWDTGWGSRLTGRLKTVFDVPEIESGFPVWRASIWSGQYEQVLHVPLRDTSTALVLRHNAIVLAMQQSFWDRFGIGKTNRVMHPLTGQPTDKNPALMGAADGVPEPYGNFALDRFIARGGVALACNLALQFEVVPLIQKADNLTEAQANEKARSLLVPGVILQPSGMFAVIRAQEAGAFYFRAS